MEILTWGNGDSSQTVSLFTCFLNFTLRFFLRGFYSSQTITFLHLMFGFGCSQTIPNEKTGGGNSCRSLLLSAVPPGPRISTGRPGGGHCYRVPARFRRHIPVSDFAAARQKPGQFPKCTKRFRIVCWMYSFTSKDVTIKEQKKYPIHEQNTQWLISAKCLIGYSAGLKSYFGIFSAN